MKTPKMITTKRKSRNEVEGRMGTKRGNVSKNNYRAANRLCARNPSVAYCLASPESHCPPCLAQLAS
eukprot:5510151-Heterocapsa_arctica.AAC.1